MSDNPKKKKRKGRPTAEQLKNPHFKEQYTSTGKEQIPFRSSPEFVKLVKGLADSLDLSVADYLRLGVFRNQRDHDKLKANPNHLDLALMTQLVPEAAKFRLLLERKPRTVIAHGLDLLKVLRDFHALNRIEDEELRAKALDLLEEKLCGVFERVRKQAALNRKEKKEEPFTTELDLA